MANIATKKEKILPSNALEEIRLGISVSDSADLPRLGLLENHFRLAIGEITRCVLVSGGHITYGGHLDPEGYTAFLVHELHRYNRRDRPLGICLAWQEHRKLSIKKLGEQKNSLGLCGEITCLNVDGIPVDPAENRPDDPVPELSDEMRKQSLPSMRRYMAKNTHGRIFIGGKREGFQGNLPGLVEEAIIALEGNQPVYLAGGFGGVTMDIVRALGVDDGSWFPVRPDAPVPDARLTKGLNILADIREQSDWRGLENGLSDDENRKLATTHRPSEIATLLTLGLGRRFHKPRIDNPGRSD